MHKIGWFTDIIGRKQQTGLERYELELTTAIRQNQTVSNLTFDPIALELEDVRIEKMSGDLVLLNQPRRWANLATFVGWPFAYDSQLEAFDVLHFLRPLPVKTQKKVIVTIHDLAPLIIPQVYPLQVRLFFRRIMQHLATMATAFIAVSDQTANDLQRLFKIDAKRVFRVYEGVDPRFSPNSDIEAQMRLHLNHAISDRYFLFIGAMNQRKNLLTLLKAFGRFTEKQVADVKLVIAGRTNWGGEITQQLISELGLDDHVIFPGYIADNDLPELIRGADALVYPSIYEGFGFPPLEAMACGTATIVADNSCLPEVTGGHAIVCPTYDIEAFAAALERLATNDQLRQQLEVNGVAHAAQFSWQTCAAETLDVYRQVLA